MANPQEARDCKRSHTMPEKDELPGSRSWPPKFRCLRSDPFDFVQISQHALQDTDVETRNIFLANQRFPQAAAKCKPYQKWMTVLPANFFPCPIEDQSVQGVPALWILAMVAVRSEPWTWQWLVSLTAW